MDLADTYFDFSYTKHIAWGHKYEWSLIGYHANHGDLPLCCVRSEERGHGRPG